MALNRAYSLLCKSVPSLLGRKNALFLHKGQVDTIEHFEGRLACGACCYILHAHLQTLGVHTTMMHKVLGREDHCFLMHGQTVIDPTYRQFIPREMWFDSFMYVGPLAYLEEHCQISFWSNARESTETMDASEVMISKRYAKNRGTFFLNLHGKQLCF